MQMPVAKFGDFLTHHKEFIQIDDTERYKRARVQLHWKGIVLRGEVEGARIKTKEQQVARAGELLVAEIDAKVGGIGIVPPEVEGAIVSSHYFLFQIDESKCTRPWVEWFVRSGGLGEQVTARGSTNYAAIRPHHVLNFELPLPPLDEQRRIVSRIGELAARVEEARQLRQETIEEAKAVLISGWRQVFSAVKSDGWHSLSIEECCEAMIDYRGRTPPLAETGIPHLTSRNIKSGRIDWSTNKFVAEETYEKYMTRGIPKPGDVIFTMEAPLGEAAVVPDQRRFSLAQRTLLLRGRSDVVGGEFLAKVIMSPQVHDEIYSKATGTTVKGIASKRLKQIPLPIPPLDEQRRIVAYLDALQAKVDALKKLQSETAAELDALMPSILAKAFRGDL